MNTNIIDAPLNGSAEDKLGTRKYVEGLSRYLSSASMPTTVAIQGQWGSGKTSFMNQIRGILCEGDTGEDPRFFGVWINMWEYSIMKSPEETMIGVIKGMTAECTKILGKLDVSSAAIHELKDKAWSFIKKSASFVASTAVKASVNAVGLNGDDASAVVRESMGSLDETRPHEFRKAFSEVVEKCLNSQPKDRPLRRGFIFFVDDLDRINPENAVQILELLKNMFEVSNCIFVLAIDYDVVVKGLRVKFGNSGTAGSDDRAFRSFFDKIIQMPFSMPVSAYDISRFLEESLKNIGYLNEGELHSEITTYPEGTEETRTVSEILTELTELSTGSNPRSIKRMINTLSLIKIINSIQEQDSQQTNSLELRDYIINYGLVCLQIAYPQIYERILQEPCYIFWDENTARQFRLPQLADGKKEILNSTLEFDEEWEQVIYRLCQTNTYLTISAMSISRLLNLIRFLEKEEKGFEERITKLLGMSAVTSVTQADTAAACQQNSRTKRLFDDPEVYLSTTMDGRAPKCLLDLVRALLPKLQRHFKDLLTMDVSRSGGIAFKVVNRRHPRIRKYMYIWVYQDKKKELPKFQIAFFTKAGWTFGMFVSEDNFPNVIWTWVTEDNYLKKTLGYKGELGTELPLNEGDDIARLCFEDMSTDKYPEGLRMSELLQEAIAECTG